MTRAGKWERVLECCGCHDIISTPLGFRWTLPEGQKCALFCGDCGSTTWIMRTARWVEQKTWWWVPRRWRTGWWQFQDELPPEHANCRCIEVPSGDECEADDAD
jgi:hypothetical protein